MPDRSLLEAEIAAIGRDDFSGTILVSYKGERIGQSFGLADREDGIANGESVIYDMGSLTKQFTAAAILHLQMTGRLSVDDALSKHVPAAEGERAEITLHQLLTHTAGLPHDLGGDYEPIGRDLFLERVADETRVDPAGNAFAYSNVGYSVLAAVVEIVSGIGYEQYLRTHLFEPAGLRETGYVLPDRAALPIAVGYANRKFLGFPYRKTMGKPDEQAWADDGPYWHLRGNGGILSSANDMLRWHDALLGTDVLDRDSVAKLYAHHVRVDAGSELYYGYGWSIEPNECGTLLVSHSGSNGVFYADLLRFLDEDIFIFIATNSFRERDRGVGVRIVDSIFDPSREPPER